MIHCSANGCGASFRKYSSFKVHCYRKHFQEAACTTINGGETSDEDENQMDTEQHQDGNDMDYELMRSEAAYLLRLKSAQRLSQTALDTIALSTRALLKDKMTMIKDKLLGNNQEPEILQALLNRELFTDLDRQASGINELMSQQ